ncbi:hypothetical protein Syun_005238 [Stephania yunnanensis]|uniref:TF-B3 domain-containing protein n=1 Tax=Stephania yunnanensis TaxID=152371 RepID=A0AAP0Q5Q7_9MAGN
MKQMSSGSAFDYVEMADHPQHSFFKVFIGQGGPAHPFSVPPPFVEALGGALPDKYTLQGPTGERRVVEVKKNGLQWFFRGGWGPFMEGYSVRYGDILVFTLHRKAVLHFQVYDRNGYLKKSPSSQDGKQVKVENTPKGSRYEDYEDEGMKESSIIEISSSSSDEELSDDEVCKPVFQAGSSLRAAEDPNEASARKHRKRIGKLHRSGQSHRSKSSTMPNLCRKNEVLMCKELNNRSIKREERVDTKVVAANRHPSSTIYTTFFCSDEQKDKLIRTAKRLKLGRPLAAVILSHTYANKGFLHFPRSFFQTFFHDELLMIAANVVKKKKGQLITFPDGKIWHVEFIFSQGVVRAVAGWRAFVCQNGLREGDFCFFEFIRTRPVIELKVSTSRPNKSYAAQAYDTYEDVEIEEPSAIEISSSSSDSQTDTCDEGSDKEVVGQCRRAKKSDVLDVESKTAVQAGSSFKTEDLNVSSARIPRKRVRFQVSRERTQDNLPRNSGSPVEKLHCSRQSQHHKSTIMPNLCRNNQGRMGKEMNDMSIKREERVDINVVAANRDPSSTIYTTMHCSDEQKNKLIRTAERLKFRRPLAAIILSQSYAKNGFVHFPKPFFETFFHDKLLMIGANVLKKKGLLISFPEGKIWHVNFLFSKGSVRAVGGWSAFVCQNGLKEGDFCYFDFIKTRPVIELRVSISRPNESHAVQAYNLYEDEKNEESSAFEISSSFSDSQNNKCNESSDEEVVVSCKRAKKTNVHDVEHKLVTRAGSSFKTKDLNVSSERNPGEEMKGRSLKRQQSADIRVVSNWQKSSSVYTVTGYSHEQRDKLVRAAQKFKFGRPLAVVSLTPSAIRHRYLYFPKPFSRTFFNDLMKISARSVKKSGRLISNADGEIWPVEFHFYGDQVRMVGGWHPFAHHNGLAVGDVCVFEFIKTSPLIELRVSTSRPRNKNTDNGSS